MLRTIDLQKNSTCKSGRSFNQVRPRTRCASSNVQKGSASSRTPGMPNVALREPSASTSQSYSTAAPSASTTRPPATGTRKPEALSYQTGCETPSRARRQQHTFPLRGIMTSSHVHEFTSLLVLLCPTSLACEVNMAAVVCSMASHVYGATWPKHRMLTKQQAHLQTLRSPGTAPQSPLHSRSPAKSTH